MKSIFFLLIGLSAQAAVAQESLLQGTVAVFNSQFDTGNRQYVANASVEEDYGKSQATTTRADGGFDLKLVGIKEQEKVFYSVKKSGMEVVNTDALQAVAGQVEPLRVLMAPEGKIAENKLKYYKINRTAAEKALRERLQGLEKAIDAAQNDPTKLRSLQTEYGQLQAQYGKIDEQAGELAERYAKTNLDDASADYQRAFRCFQRGALDSALMVFQAADLERDASAVLLEQDRNKDLAAEYVRRKSDKTKRKGETMEALRFKAQLHQTQYDFYNTEKCYLLLLRLDSTDVENIKPYAMFLAYQGRFEKSIYYHKTLLKLVSTEPEKAFVFNSLANTYFSNKDSASTDAYREAVKIYEHLNKIHKDNFLPNLAIVLDNLGSCYRDAGRLAQSKQPLKKSLKIYKNLIKQDAATFTPYLALSLNSMGRYYYDRKKMWRAYKYFNKSLDYYQKSADAYASAIPVNLESYYTINILYFNNVKSGYYKLSIGGLSKKYKRFVNNKYLFLLNKALKTHKQLAIDKPDVFLPFVALTLANLGNVYYLQGEPKQAMSMFQEALSIQRNLVQKNPNATLPFMAKLLTNLGEFHLAKNDLLEAHKNFEEALSIYKKLSKLSPKTYVDQINRLEKHLAAIPNVRRLRVFDKKIH